MTILAHYHLEPRSQGSHPEAARQGSITDLWASFWYGGGSKGDLGMCGCFHAFCRGFGMGSSSSGLFPTGFAYCRSLENYGYSGLRFKESHAMIP